MALWLLGFGLMLGRLLLALRYVRRLRRRVSPVPAAWQQMLARLVARAGFARAVELRASALVPSPIPDDAPRPPRPALAASDDELRQLLQRQLQADGLLRAPDHYTIDLTSYALLVNGQPQPAAFLARYQRLYEAATGRLMMPATTYHTQNEVTCQAAVTATRPAPAHAALLRQLRYDGLLPADRRPLQVAVTGGGVLLVNGQPQPPARLAAYRSLLPLPPPSAGSTTTLTVRVP